jgi:mRNA interferase YafQ
MKKIDYSNKIHRDIKHLISRKYDMSEFHEVVRKLRSGEKLDRKYQNHPMKGKHKGEFDLHINPNWVLIYQKTDDCIYLLRTGTHTDLDID